MNTPTLILCELAPAGLPRHESYSPFCMKVHRALRLSGLPYESRHGRAPDEYKHLNPARQVPVLLVSGEPVSDSTRIVSRLEELSGGALSQGLDARGRAEAFLVEEFADTVLYAFVVAARWADDENWARTRAAYFGGMPALLRAFLPDRLRARVLGSLYARDATRPDLATCWARFETTLDALEARAPATGFWLSDAPTRADVALFAQLFSFGTDLTPAQRASVAARPRLFAYLERVDAACERADARGRSGVYAVTAERPRAAAFG